MPSRSSLPERTRWTYVSLLAQLSMSIAAWPLGQSKLFASIGSPGRNKVQSLHGYGDVDGVAVVIAEEVARGLNGPAVLSPSSSLPQAAVPRKAVASAA